MALQLKLQQLDPVQQNSIYLCARVVMVCIDYLHVLLCVVIVTVQFVVEFLIARDSGGSKWRTIARWRRGELIFVYLFPCTHFENKCCSIQLCLYCWACLFCCELLSVVEERRTASCMTTIPGSAFFMHLPELTRPTAAFWKQHFQRYILEYHRSIPPLFCPKCETTIY